MWVSSHLNPSALKTIRLFEACWCLVILNLLKLAFHSLRPCISPKLGESQEEVEDEIEAQTQTQTA